MNKPLEQALKIYGDDFHKLLYWHLCFGVVVSDTDSFCFGFYSRKGAPEQACEIHNSDTLFVTMCVGDMQKSLGKFQDDFEHIAFQREFKNSPHIRVYDMQKFYSKLK